MARRKTPPNAVDIDFLGSLTDEVTPHADACLARVEIASLRRVDTRG